ncbi:MAG: hypothetical protein WCO57_00985 [Verrucomicrobiota bacterium]
MSEVLELPGPHECLSSSHEWQPATQADEATAERSVKDAHGHVKDHPYIQWAAALCCGVLAATAVLAQEPAAAAPAQQPVVVCPAAGAPQLQLAAKELARYIYLRTGRLPRIVATVPERGEVIRLAADASLGAGAFRIQTAPHADGRMWTITGNEEQGVLYGAYRFAEKLGVRFYLHGDVIPDTRLESLPDVNDQGAPLFALRGLNPWGSHPFGFDAWGSDDYKAVFTQLAKMRMNFLGIHCYPEGQPYAEPTVWLGQRGEFDAQGRVSASYPSHYYNTLAKGFWGPVVPKTTSEYSFGGALLFEGYAWAPEVMRDHCPEPTTPDACNQVFNRMADQFHDAFGFARQLGVKTCIGTEAPMILPQALRDRLRAQGKNPADPATVRDVYEAMFRRIAASHPLDYFWLWTPEGWTWEGNQPKQYSNTISDVRLAIEALKNSGAAFKLATSGWVLGPQQDRAAFDNDLPKDIPMSAISQQLGYTAVDPAFGRIQGRDKWAIPWLESDGKHGLAAIQLCAGRMRRDAADALAYGCTGLMGLQWRSDILGPNISALAQASWDQSGWNAAPGKVPTDANTRCMACDDFYADWAGANFGAAAGADIARVFAAVDGRLPLSVADGCPTGTLKPDPTPWATVAATYACVTTLEQLRPQVQGAGSLERFDWWLNTFRYHRGLHQLRCALAQPQADEVARLWREIYHLLLATVNSPGGLAAVVNLEQHAEFGPKVVPLLARPLPQDYEGPTRIIVPTLRSVVTSGERLKVKFIVLDKPLPQSVTLTWRPLGHGEFRSVPARHVARATYSVELPVMNESFEYRIEVTSAAGQRLAWPVTAPQINHTVVVWDAATML